MDKMRSVCFLSQLLLFLAFSLHRILAQTPPGFISLDCGLQGSNGYKDPITSLFYTTDEAYIDTGDSKSISPELKTNSLPPQFSNVRSFPGQLGSRNCYTFRPLNGKDHKILLRVGFMYGNYDNKSKPPTFDLHLGVDYWETVMLNDSSSVYVTEILHVPTSDHLFVCVVNTGAGTPFVSLIELRPMDSLKPIYETTSGSLKLLSRWDLGSLSSDVLRDTEGDPYDRIWTPVGMTNTTAISTEATTWGQNSFKPPPMVMRTAAEQLDINGSFTFTLSSDNVTDQYYIYFHFAELVPNKSREIVVYRNGFPNKVFIPPYLSVLTAYSIAAQSLHTEYKINASSKSKFPPILNAVEIYSVKRFQSYETVQDDVGAVISIREEYGIRKNWQGDPCLPHNFTWSGISCSYKALDSPSIISLNLSSSGLVGTIARSISRLTKLQSLDLSYNNLSGQVPDFLCWMPSLRYLYLQGNNFSSLPGLLQEKSRDGFIFLSMDSSLATGTLPCANDACKKKNSNSTTVPIVASVAAVLAIFILSALLFVFIRKKQQAVKQQRVMVESTPQKDDSCLEPQLRQYTYSEVTSMIQGNKLLGEGGFGNVYRGHISGVEVAVKILKESPDQQTKDFQSEVKILATVHHSNLTRILGYCNEGMHRAIIFEFMEMGNLRTHLLGNNPDGLSWERRLSILAGAAQGLEYLHHGCDPPIIHRDIKPDNILLTKEFEAKLADFGLSRNFPVQSSRVVGTHGYHDPQYDEPGMLTEKIDIYSFGVVMLVVITGEPAFIHQTTHIIQWVAPKITTGDITAIVDPRLQGKYDVHVAWRVVELAMACVSPISSSRPNMRLVAKELQECLQTAESAQEHGDVEDGVGVVPSAMLRPSAR